MINPVVKRSLFLIFIFIFLSKPVFSQFSGRLIDAHTKNPIINARICIENDCTLYSDSGGFFTIKSALDTLFVTINHLGYKPYSIRMMNNDFIVISLFPKNRNLNEVWVSASKFNKKFNESDASIGLLISELYNEGKLDHISGLLNDVPGVYMHYGTYTTSRIVIRGIGSRNPYGTNRIKAFLNHIPLTGGDGVTIIDDLSISDIGRIEITKGPSSAMHGAGLAGTINIYTNYPAKSGLSLKSLFQSGSFGFQKYFVSASQKGKKSVLSTAIGREVSSGYRENSNYHNNHLLVNGIWFLPKSEIQYLLNMVDLKAFIPSSIDKDTYINNPKAAAANWKDIKGYEQYDKILSGISAKRKLKGQSFVRATVYSTFTGLNELRPFNFLESENINYGIRTDLNLNFKTFNFNTGLDFMNEVINWRTFENNAHELIDDFKEQRKVLNLYIFGEATVFKKVLLNTSINFNFLQFFLRKSNNTSFIPDKYNYSPIVSPRVGVNFALYPNINVYGSVSHGFSAPSFEETMLPDGNRNNDLKPETGWNMETGLKGHLWNEKIIFDVNIYQIFVRNLLVTKRFSEEYFMGVNAGKTSHSGIELYLQYNIYNNVKHTFSYVNTFSISKNKFIQFVDDGIDYSNNTLPGIPWIRNTSKLTWNLSDWAKMSISLQHNGSQYLEDGNVQKLNAFSILKSSIRINKFISKKINLSLTIGVENLLNEHYASMILINAPSFGGSAPRYYYPGLPRNYFLKLSLNL